MDFNTIAVAQPCVVISTHYKLEALLGFAAVVSPVISHPHHPSGCARPLPGLPEVINQCFSATTCFRGHQSSKLIITILPTIPHHLHTVHHIWAQPPFLQQLYCVMTTANLHHLQNHLYIVYLCLDQMVYNAVRVFSHDNTRHMALNRIYQCWSPVSAAFGYELRLLLCRCYSFVVCVPSL